MKIIINKEYGYNFVNAIKRKIIRDIKLSINMAKLYPIDRYLSEVLLLDYSAIDIINFSLKHFVIIIYDDKYELKIDENIIYRDNIKLISLVKLINFGNLELRPYSIYTNEFNEITNNIDNLYIVYKRTGIVI